MLNCKVSITSLPDTNEPRLEWLEKRPALAYMSRTSGARIKAMRDFHLAAAEDMARRMNEPALKDSINILSSSHSNWRIYS